MTLAAPGLSDATRAIELSRHPQLFLDDHVIARMENVRREIQRPVKHPASPMIVQDRPWETRVVQIYGTVLYEPQRGKFRCWYLACANYDGDPDVPEGQRTKEYFQCYAESDDGIRWNKPNVACEAYGDVGAPNNIVIRGAHGFCVLPPDADEMDPNRRYKGGGGAVYGFSPDGIRWTLHNWRDRIGKNDTGTSIVRWRGQYLAFVRYQISDPIWPGVMRGVGLSVSDDFTSWTPKELVFHTDAADGYPWTQPYGLSVTPYGEQLIGMLWMLHLDEIDGNNRLGDMDVQLVVSRDGRTWNRVADRSAFLAPTPGTWDAGRVFPGTTMFLKNDQVYVYYTGTNTRHGEAWGKVGIGLATLPADRFVALTPALAGAVGTIETKPLQTDGRELVINVDGGQASVKIELVSPAGEVLDGFGHAQCRLTRLDALRYRVMWSDDGAMHRSFGNRRNATDMTKPVALRFLIVDSSARLYAFAVTD